MRIKWLRTHLFVVPVVLPYVPVFLRQNLVNLLDSRLKTPEYMIAKRVPTYNFLLSRLICQARVS